MLIRAWDLKTDKQVNLGPAPHGVFMAHALCHDLKSWQISCHDLPFLLQNGRLWFGDVVSPGKTPEWRRVYSQGDIPHFRVVVNEGPDGTPQKMGLPFMPQFYWLPINGRGRKHLNRAHNRAIRRL